MSSHQPLKATVSGSFRRAMSAVEDAVYRLTDAGATVLSPADPRVVDQFGDFLFVASDRARVIKLVQSRHLAAIEASDLLWLVDPDGYIGVSGAMEIGFAVATGTPVFSSEVPADLTLRQYVTTCPAPEKAVEVVRQQRQGPGSVSRNLLLDPSGTLQEAHDDLEVIASDLRRGTGLTAERATAAAERLRSQIARPLIDG